MKVLKIVAVIAGVELTAGTKDGIDASRNLTKLSILKDGADSADENGVIKITRPGLSMADKIALAAGRSEAKAGARGLTIPVRLRGPFDALKYRIDFAAVATEAVKQQVQEKVQVQLQGRLKGLLKR